MFRHTSNTSWMGTAIAEGRDERTRDRDNSWSNE